MIIPIAREDSIHGSSSILDSIISQSSSIDRLVIHEQDVTVSLSGVGSRTHTVKLTRSEHTWATIIQPFKSISDISGELIYAVIIFV